MLLAMAVVFSGTLTVISSTNSMAAAAENQTVTDLTSENSAANNTDTTANVLDAEQSGSETSSNVPAETSPTALADEAATNVLDGAGCTTGVEDVSYVSYAWDGDTGSLTKSDNSIEGGSYCLLAGNDTAGSDTAWGSKDSDSWYVVTDEVTISDGLWSLVMCL